MFPDTARIAGKPESLSFRHRETFGGIDSFGKSLLPIVIEGGRKIQEFPAAQGAQASIEVVEPVVNQLQRNDLPVKPIAEYREHTDIRPLPIASEPGVGKSQEVSCSLEVKARFQSDHFVSPSTKPVFEACLFSLPLRIAKTAWHRFASYDDAGVCREYQVRQSWHRLHPFQNRICISFEHLHQVMPLADGLT